MAGKEIHCRLCVEDKGIGNGTNARAVTRNETARRNTESAAFHFSLAKHTEHKTTNFPVYTTVPSK